MIYIQEEIDNNITETEIKYGKPCVVMNFFFLL